MDLTNPTIGAVRVPQPIVVLYGSGVALATWLGHQTALKLLGRAERLCPFDGLEFPTRPLYYGRPWFLPAVGAWYRLRDALDAWRPG